MDDFIFLITRGFSGLFSGFEVLTLVCFWLLFLSCFLTHFWKAAAVSQLVSVLRCSSSLLLLFTHCKVVRWSLGHRDVLRWVPGARMVSDALGLVGAWSGVVHL